MLNVLYLVMLGLLVPKWVTELRPKHFLFDFLYMQCANEDHSFYYSILSIESDIFKMYLKILFIYKIL